MKNQTQNKSPLADTLTVGQESVAHDRREVRTVQPLPVGQESIAHDRSPRRPSKPEEKR